MQLICFNEIKSRIVLLSYIGAYILMIVLGDCHFMVGIYNSLQAYRTENNFAFDCVPCVSYCHTWYNMEKKGFFVTLQKGQRKVKVKTIGIVHIHSPS